MENSLTPIALVIPYFGKLPDYFPVWKMSARFNETVDFLFFTDIDELQSDGNIKVYHMSFEEFRDIIQRKFPFEISLKRPYKLCDYKPVYGYALEKYLKPYRFWGHCDIDLIFGDIRKFVTEEILDAYDKILEHGHFTLYRNTPAINEHFMCCAGYGGYDYKKVFTSDDSLYFDECLGMRLISRKMEIATYLNEDCFFDVIPSRKEFIHISGERGKTVFGYENGCVFALTKSGDAILKQEIMYAHFQKRRMDFSAVKAYDPAQTFYIVPNKAKEKLSFRCYGKSTYALRAKIKHLIGFWTRFRRSNVSFRQYRATRLVFHNEMVDAKSEIKKMNEQRDVA